LGDRSGEMPARMWSIEEPIFRRLPTEGFVYVEGETQAYQGEMQLIIHVIEPIEPTAEQLRDLLPCSKRDPEEMFAELTKLLDTLEHPVGRCLRRVAGPSHRRAGCQGVIGHRSLLFEGSRKRPECGDDTTGCVVMPRFPPTIGRRSVGPGP
jgi:hypothetical protein